MYAKVCYYTEIRKEGVKIRKVFFRFLSTQSVACLARFLRELF